MSSRHLLYVLVIVALLAVMTLTAWEVFGVKAVPSADHGSYPIGQNQMGTWPTSNATALGVQQPRTAFSASGHRGGLNPKLALYQQALAAGDMSQPVTDHSYDAIERLRAQRTSP
jgi:hypothetical protein